MSQWIFKMAFNKFITIMPVSYTVKANGRSKTAGGYLSHKELLIIYVVDQ